MYLSKLVAMEMRPGDRFGSIWRSLIRRLPILVICVALIGIARGAAIVGPAQISFAGSTGVETVNVGSFAQTIDGIFDEPGMNPNNNGVSLDLLPLSVTYDFDTKYDLTSFAIFGEFGSNGLNAVRDFQITAFSGVNGSGMQIGAVFSATHNTPSTLQFFNLGPGSYLGVRSFRFTPLSVQDGTDRVEWSEIQFEGTASPTDPNPVPEPATLPTVAGVTAIGYLMIRSRRRGTPAVPADEHRRSGDVAAVLRP